MLQVTNETKYSLVEKLGSYGLSITQDGNSIYLARTQLVNIIGKFNYLLKNDCLSSEFAIDAIVKNEINT